MQFGESGNNQIMQIMLARCWFSQEQPGGATAGKDLHTQQNRGNWVLRCMQVKRTPQVFRVHDSRVVPHLVPGRLPVLVRAFHIDLG